MKSTRLYVGDIIEIPLPNGKKALAHYLFRDHWGDIIGVFDYQPHQTETVDLDVLIEKPFAFSPILTRINVGIKSPDYKWKIIGRKSVEHFVYPNFVWKDGGPYVKNSITKWYLSDGKSDVEVGVRLPKKYIDLEYQANYAPAAVIERIISGKKNFADVIQNG
jgi:hypothetical protein